jgi:ABC-type transport system involved in multi-copper enzyme maturation permease subunit
VTTATARPLRAAPGGRPRLPMLWVTWRQHRRSLLSALTLFAAAALVLVITGVIIHAEPAALRPRIWALTQDFDNSSGTSGVGDLTPLVVLSFLIGAFVGAPVVARELQAGTAQFAWTQGIGRARLVGAKLVLIALILASAATAVGLIFQWWFAPYATDRLGNLAFGLYAPVFVGGTIASFALAAFLGAALRSTVAPITMTVIGIAIVAGISSSMLKLNLSPVTGPQASMPVGSTEFEGFPTQPDGRPLSATVLNSFTWVHGSARGWLAQHHAIWTAVYQPPSRFWTFELIEAGGLLLAAVLLGAATLWLIRRPSLVMPLPALPLLTEPAAFTPARTELPTTPATAPLRPRIPAAALPEPPPIAARRRFGMGWVTWRQHRAALGWLLVPAGILAAVLVYTYPRIHPGYQVLVRGNCFARLSANCQGSLGWLDSYPAHGVSDAMIVLAALMAMYLGAPAVARELEWGTYRFTLTQGTGRARWVTSRMALLSAAVTAITLPLALLVSWWIWPFERAGMMDHWFPAGFVLAAPVCVTWTVFTLSVAILIGAALRRVVPAIGVTLAGYLVLANLAVGLLHFLLSLFPRVAPGSPISEGSGAVAVQHGRFLISKIPVMNRAGQGPAGSWVVNGWYVGPHGRRLSLTAGRRITAGIPRRLTSEPGQVAHWLTQHHLTYWVSYQPADRFWLFQGIAAAGLLGLAALAGAATIWLIRRRPA